MSYGFEVYNSSEIVLANSKDYGYAYFTSGSFTLSAAGGVVSDPFALVSGSINSIDMNSANDAKPLVFIRPSNTNLYYSVYGLGNNSFKILFSSGVSDTYFGNTFIYADSVGSTTIDYMVFLPTNKVPAYSGTDNYGMQVRAANSDLVFDSRYELPKIRAVVGTPAIPFPSNTFTNTALPVGLNSSNCWVCVNEIAGAVHGFIGQGGQYGYHAYYAFRINGSTLTTTLMLVRVPLFAPGTGLSSTTIANTPKNFLLAVQPTLQRPVSSYLRQFNPGFFVSLFGNYQSCSYTSGSTCETYSIYNMFAYGGNNSPWSYSWYLSGPGAGNFSLTTSGDSNARVSSSLSNGTYSCTLNCTASQTGSPSTTSSITVTHTHTNPNIPPPVPTVYDPLQFNNNTYTNSTTNGTSSISLQILRDGSWQVITSSGAIQATAYWINLPSATVGDSYYVKFVRTSNIGTSGGSTTQSQFWTQLNTGRSITASATSNSATQESRTSTYAVYIANAASDNNIVSSSTITIGAFTYKA